MPSDILEIGLTGKTEKRVAQRLQKRGLAVRYGTHRSDIPFDLEYTKITLEEFQGTLLAEGFPEEDA